MRLFEAVLKTAKKKSADFRKTPTSICKYLEIHGIHSPGGKEKWSKSTIVSILSNEKYKGDSLLQKKIMVDYLEKKMKINEGEVPQYYVEGSHPAIIEPDEWDHVQAEIERRKRLGKPTVAKAHSWQSWFVKIAVVSLDQRPGIQPISIVGQYDSATANLQTANTAKHPLLTPRRFIRFFLKHTTR